MHGHKRSNNFFYKFLKNKRKYNKCHKLHFKTIYYLSLYLKIDEVNLLTNDALTTHWKIYILLPVIIGSFKYTYMYIRIH